MSSKRRLRRRQCGDKVRYATEADAAKARGPLRRILQPYSCSFCGSFHLGHPTRAKRQSIAARRRNQLNG